MLYVLVADVAGNPPRRTAEFELLKVLFDFNSIFKYFGD